MAKGKGGGGNKIKLAIVLLVALALAAMFYQREEGGGSSCQGVNLGTESVASDVAECAKNDIVESSNDWLSNLFSSF